jgi:hypothetical protein
MFKSKNHCRKIWIYMPRELILPKKVEFTLEQALKAQKKGRDIALLFL